MNFSELKLNNPLLNALNDLGIDTPTPIQEKSFPVILSGKDVVGIAQTGTGKTFAYLLPILRDLKFSKQLHPRVLILLPTRELVLQVVTELEKLTSYMNTRILGIHAGANINKQAALVKQGVDIVVATPVRIYDLAIARAISFKTIQKLVIDEVDVMLDLGFKFQIANVLQLLPKQRQSLLFSATMTQKVSEIIQDSFIDPVKISIAVSGTPLENIQQQMYHVKNFNTKLNLLEYLLADKNVYSKTIIFTSSKQKANLLFECLEDVFPGQSCVIHANKNQNYRLRSIENFENGQHRVLIATDVIARGIDFEEVSQVISMDTPAYPENYMHRIGRTGRAAKKGQSLLFASEAELPNLEAIESLMQMKIEEVSFPEEVEVSAQLIPEERPKALKKEVVKHKNPEKTGGGAFHEKSKKNSKENLGSSYWRSVHDGTRKGSKKKR